eukprot:scaffold1681_cov242-Prasinococcus_capsulatus_cf.AAC.10
MEFVGARGGGAPARCGAGRDGAKPIGGGGGRGRGGGARPPAALFRRARDGHASGPFGVWCEARPERERERGWRSRGAAAPLRRAASGRGVGWEEGEHILLRLCSFRRIVPYPRVLPC